MTGYVSAHQIVARLKGRWALHSGTCPCPAHDDRSPSLSVTDAGRGKVLVHCFAGCRQQEVIAALQRLGLWGNSGAEQDPSAPWNYIPKDRPPNDPERRTRAMTVWEKAKPAPGTLAETYLRGRGIKGPISDQIRYHPAIRHSPTKTDWPCLISRLSDNRGFCAIQRTFLAKDGSGKAPVEGAKRTLGTMGAGAVRLKPLGPSGFLGLAEGLESAWSASRLYSVPVWATLGAYRLGAIDLPIGVKVLTIFGDPGDVGRQEAFKAADIYERAGVPTECIFPAAHFVVDAKADFNTVLQARA